MWKVLLVIASVVLGGALYLSFDNMGVFKQKQVDIEVEKKKIAELTVSLDKTSAEVTQLEQSIQMLTEEASTLQTAKIDLDALLAVEQGIADNLDAVFLEPLVEDPFGDVRLEEPHRVVAHVGRVHSLSERGVAEIAYKWTG